MDKYDVVVLGAGPAGLSAAYTLSNAGLTVGLFDKNEKPGGLCRSFQIDGFTFDTFAHVNFSKDPYVMSMLENETEYLIHTPEAFNYSNGKWIRNPVQNNLKVLDIDEKVSIIKSFMTRNDNIIPKNYDDWLKKQYGEYFSSNYPAKYTRKYWTVEPFQLEPKWVEGRMYTPSIEEVLRGAMTDEVPNVHYSKEIHYPRKGGYENFLTPFVSDYFYGNKEVVTVDVKSNIVKFQDDSEVYYDELISTIPLGLLISAFENVDVPSSVKEASKQLDYTSGVMVSIGLKGKHRSPALWFYIYDEDILPARVYCPNIKSPNNVPEGCSALQAEVYYSKYKLLKKDIEQIKNDTINQLIKMGLFEKEQVVVADARAEKYANVMFTPPVYNSRKTIHDFLDEIGIKYAGRFGEWAYLWTGQSILSGKSAAEKIIAGIK